MKKNFALKKIYYSISEVSKITDLEQYVLRYWETEFDILKPAKNLAGNRIYTNKDIKLILHIKKLLREEKYTIEGAKKLLKNYSIKEGENEISHQSNLPADMVKESNKYSSPKSTLTLFGGGDNLDNQDEKANSSKLLKNDLMELRVFLSNLLENI